jgi:putative RecB family exonuclease
MIFSHSQLETYENCPQKYWLSYIERVRSTRRSIEAFNGSLVHESLEKLYRDLRMGRHPRAADLEGHFLEAWKASFDSDVFIVNKDYSAEDYRELGLRCLRDYYHHYHPFDQGLVVWLEQPVRIAIDDGAGGRVDFRGVVDRLDSLKGGRYEVHDYKTSISLPAEEQIRGDRQLSLYQMAVERAFSDVEDVELVWHYLVFNRECRLHREPDEIRKVAAEAAELARKIERAADFPARESELCDWCEVQERCSKRKHIFMAVQPGARELDTERGVELADEYRKWTARKQEAERRLEELRDEVGEFCAFYGADNLRGNSCTLRVSRQKTLKLPPSGSAARENLERLLREAGAWDRISALNPQRLASALKHQELDQALSDSMESFLRWEESLRLRVIDD